MFAPKNILVPTDFSEYSDKALQLALDIAKQYHSRIYLLHVIGLVNQCSVEYCLDSKTIDLVEKESMAYARQMMGKQLGKFRIQNHWRLLPISGRELPMRKF